MASAGAIALVALGAGVNGYRLPTLPLAATHAHAATMSSSSGPVTVPAASTQMSDGFANLVAKVDPAVVSVKVKIEQPVAFQGNDNQDSGNNTFPQPPNWFFQFGPGRQFSLPQPRNQLMMGEGAGFFISADGYIVTADHVVKNARSIEVTTNDGSVYKAHVIGTDPGTDMALIKVDANKTFPYVKFADTPPRVGDWVVAIGSPFGLGNTATAGIVSALARDIGTSTYDNFLQIDAPINQGNSGGPTFDMQGNVVGINDAIFTPSGGSVGIGFDIPASIAKKVTAQLEKSGHVTRAWLGVQIQDVTQGIADSLGMKKAEGALVAQPEANGPAARAGIQAGDVITAVNGTDVQDARGLAQQIGKLAPGTSVKLGILHHGTAKTVDLTLGTMPQQQHNPPA